MKFERQPLTVVLKEIQKQTAFRFIYTKSQMDKAARVTVNVTDVSLTQALDLCFKEQNLKYEIKAQDNVIVILDKPATTSIPSSSAVDHLITGRVTNKEGEPLGGTTVQVEGKPRSTLTDANGQYSIEADGNDRLVFSFVTYQQENQSVKERRTINVVLVRNDAVMQEVVISTGYQKIDQKYMTGAATRLSMDSIYQPGLMTVDKMLEGRVPGLIMMQNSGQPGAAPKLRIRGTSTILGSREPLWVVDGIIQTDPVPVSASKINDLDFVNLVGNAISGLNPHDIQDINVLKDAAATGLYGIRAANGVIVVTTKRGKPGPPSFRYSTGTSYMRRMRYSDKEVFLMNSQQRVDVSRELIEKQLPLRGRLEEYEQALIDYYNGIISYETYRERVKLAETVNTDWFKAVMQDGISTDHSFNVSGGSTGMRYYGSAGYSNETGPVKGEYNKRYTGLLRLDISQNKFNGQISLSYSRNKRSYLHDNVKALNYAFSTSRTMPLYNSDGSLHFHTNDKTGPWRVYNIVNEMNHSGQNQETQLVTATGNFDYSIVRGLKASLRLNYTGTNTEYRSWFDQHSFQAFVERNGLGLNVSLDSSFDPAADWLPFGGELTRNSINTHNSTIGGQLDFTRYLGAGKVHMLNLTLGGEIVSQKSERLQQVNRGYYPDRGETFTTSFDSDLYTAFADWILFNSSPNILKPLSNTVSAYFSSMYVYKDSYVLQFNTRQDYTNAFGSHSNRRFLPTWSISGSWNMSNTLLKNIDWIDRVVWRLSYGTQGNMLGSQTPNTVIKRGSKYTNYDAFSSTIDNYPNPNLSWEKTHSYNTGLNFTLFNNKVSGSIDFYYKKTVNAFLTKKVSLVNGTPSYVVNAGDIENKGIDLGLSFMPVNRLAARGGKKGFVWRLDPNLGQVFNKLLDRALGKGKSKVIVDMNSIYYVDFLNGSVPVNGRSINTFYAYRFKGLDANGQPVFYGLEPENKQALLDKFKTLPKEELYQAVMVEAGRREPVIQGGINNYFGYGNWSLSFNLAYSLGNKIRLLRIASGAYGTANPTGQQNLRAEFVNRWRYAGDEAHTNIPGLIQTSTPGGIMGWWQMASSQLVYSISQDLYQMYDDSDLRVVSGNYLKLQSIALGYTLSPELCKKLSLKAADCRLTGINLFTIASKELKGQDPIQSGTSPNINLSLRPIYSFQVNLTF